MRELLLVVGMHPTSRESNNISKKVIEKVDEVINSNKDVIFTVGGNYWNKEDGKYDGSDKVFTDDICKYLSNRYATLATSDELSNYGFDYEVDEEHQEFIEDPEHFDWLLNDWYTNQLNEQDGFPDWGILKLNDGIFDINESIEGDLDRYDSYDRLIVIGNLSYINTIALKYMFNAEVIIDEDYCCRSQYIFT